MTYACGLAPANFVPAAAVRRWERALSIMTGRKAFVDGQKVLKTKAMLVKVESFSNEFDLRKNWVS